jgi:sugar transferase (PEP-CTERM system associated)
MLRIFGHFVPAATVALGIAEALFIAAALYFGVTLSSAEPVAQIAGGRVLFPLVLAFAIIVMMHSSGLYNVDALVDARQMLLRGALILTLIVILAIAVTTQFGAYRLVHVPYRWRWIVLLPSLWLFCIVITRTIFSRVSRTGILRRRVLILGQGPRAVQLRELAKERFGAYFLPVAQVGLHDKVHVATVGAVQLKERVDSVDLLSLAREVNASEIVIATDDRRGLPVNQLLSCKLSGIRITDYVEFYERESGRVDLSALRPSWFIFSDGFRMGATVEAIKRSFDIGLGLLTLIFVLPILILTVIAIKSEGTGTILYRQERVGLRGRTFVLLKFRSMAENAERDGAPVWASKRDPRITRVGWFIRKLRIDELPQLYNVLRGDMSFVGPRPERPYFVNRLAQNIPYYDERHAVKPGITGWAQVNYPYAASLEDARNKLSYDLYYLKNRGLFLDLIILIRTVRVVLWPDGAR